jgi:Ras-related protein Rab-11A
VEFATSSLTMSDGKLAKVQIWDTAGQERYRAITSAYYRGAVGALVVYDITARRSFAAVDRWLMELRSHASRDMVIMLVGNKVDLMDKRQVGMEEGRALAEREGLLFLETSALSGEHVKPAFETVVTRCYEQVKKHRLEAETSEEEAAVGAGRKIAIEPTNAEQRQSSRCCS